MAEADDWCAEGRARVENGSDGLWIRCGTANDGSCKASLFSFSFNPCVSFFSLVLLFGLVGLCSIPPGEYCSVQKTTYIWKVGSESYQMQTKDYAAKGDPSPPGGLTLLEAPGSASEGAATMAGSFSNAVEQDEIGPGTWSSIKIKVMEIATKPTCDVTVTPADLGDISLLTTAQVAAKQSTLETLKAELRDRGLCQTWKWEVDTNNGFGYDGTAETRLQPQECFMPQKEFGAWMQWAADCFTWIYIITQDVWIVFLLGVAAYPKYGKLVMGKPGDVPEFSDFGFFAMLFTCGVATGLYFFAVTEPLYYYLGPKNQGFGGEATGNPGYYERNRFTFSGVYVDPATGAEAPVYATPNHRAQNAMTLTFYHWGLHGWVVYCLIGVLLGFMVFRKGMPMTIKTCFYPLLGNRIYGFCGDFVDTISVVATTMGVCTSLGMGVMQLNAGIQLMNGGQHWFGEGFYNEFNLDKFMDDDALSDYWNSWPITSRGNWFCSADDIATLVTRLLQGYSGCHQGESCYSCDPSRGGRNWVTAAKVATIATENDQQMFLIVMVSIAAVTSVIVGLKNGIKNLAVFCLVLGQFIIFYVWMMDDTWFLTNLLTQSLGDYMSQLVSLGFYCGAVEQTEVNNPYGEYSTWMRWWTIFYWGWWIAWAPFVGVFNARLAKGRTVREFIMASMVISVLYNFIFLDILGGAGLKMQMLAEKHQVGTSGCSGSSQLMGEFDYSSADLLHSKYNTKEWRAVEQYVTDDSDQAKFLDTSTIYRDNGLTQNICRPSSTGKYSTQGEFYCSTITNLACSMSVEGGSYPLFHVVGQYGEMSKFMIVITLIGLGFYFVCSSDSGSMVDDMVCANGILEPNLIQRLLWASTECAAACSLMNVGKYVGSVDGALKALRAISIVVGVPYTFFCIIMTLALYRAFQYECGERKWGKGFKYSICDVGFSLYTCGEGKERCCNFQRGNLDAGRVCQNAIAFLCPVPTMLQTGARLDDVTAQKTGARSFWSRVTAVLSCLAFYVGWILIFADYAAVTEDPTQWGSIMGNITHPSGNSEYYMSNRFGYYKQWGNDGIEHGDKIVYNTQLSGDYARVNGNYQGASIGGLSLNSKDASDAFVFKTKDGQPLSVALGDAAAKSRRLATIGWFLIMMVFCGNVTFFRQQMRAAYGIPGNLAEDYFCSWFWPTCLSQMVEQARDEPLGKQEANI